MKPGRVWEARKVLNCQVERRLEERRKARSSGSLAQLVVVAAESLRVMTGARPAEGRGGFRADIPVRAVRADSSNSSNRRGGSSLGLRLWCTPDWETVSGQYVAAGSSCSRRFHEEAERDHCSWECTERSACWGCASQHSQSTSQGIRILRSQSKCRGIRFQRERASAPRPTNVLI